MKKNSMLEERRKQIPNEIRKSVSYSFAIVDKIHEMLEQQGRTQTDINATKLSDTTLKDEFLPLGGAKDLLEKIRKEH